MQFDLPSKSNKRLLSYFLMLFVVAVIYFSFKAFSNVENEVVQNNNNSELTSNVSSPYFLPPENTVIEVEVTGRVVKTQSDSAPGTHEILDGNGGRIIYAKTDDDKLKQQEGSVITLVGNIPVGTEVETNNTLDVSYISIK